MINISTKHYLLNIKSILIFSIWLIISCSSTPTSSKKDSKSNTMADIIAVQVSGSENAYTFSVTIQSPDSGCGQYADWWEVLSTSGNLLYRRILTHSHVNEQPFTRSGGPLQIKAGDSIYVRAHMHPAGYGGEIFSGSVNNGFAADSLLPEFNTAIEN